MPHYFFHTANGERHRDRSGVDLPDDAAARVEAIRFTGAVMTDEPDVLWDGRDFRVEVTDAEQRPLFTIITLAVDAPRFASE
ncbi:hypothetical protein [Sphingomonas sp.]|uniref:DUF6894 family protein n=1 Tax=Sphingomonas sp. TaxID=28214 RepID=UPI0035BC9199